MLPPVWLCYLHPGVRGPASHWKCQSGEVETSVQPIEGPHTTLKTCSVMGEASIAAAFCGWFAGKMQIPQPWQCMMKKRSTANPAMERSMHAKATVMARDERLGIKPESVQPHRPTTNSDHTQNLTNI